MHAANAVSHSDADVESVPFAHRTSGSWNLAELRGGELDAADLAAVVALAVHRGLVAQPERRVLSVRSYL